MATFGQYRVNLLDWTGNKVSTLFPGNDFLSIAWEHKRNEPGTYRADFVGETGTKDQFKKHYQVQIQRNWGNDPANWYTEYTGFHLGFDETWPTGDVDEHYWASLGLSPEWLVTLPMLQPLATSNPDYLRYSLWWAHGAADDVLKAMVAESMVSPTDTTRQFTQMAVQGNTGEAIWGCYEGNWIRLSDAMIDAVGEDGTKGGCDFRVEPVSGGYEFRTFTPFYGTDRRRGNAYGNKPVVFSFQNGNMKNPRRQVLWAEAVTVAYGGWQGSGATQTIYEETNGAALAETPWARREQYYDVADVATPDAVSAWLQQKMIDEGEKEFVSAEIMQTDACLYGRDWGFGDLVTLDLPGGLSYDMRIIEVAGRMSGQNEEEIVGTVELWTREEGA